MNELMIGRKIQSFRKQKGFTLAEVAGKSELTKGTLSKIERGQISPPISTLVRIGKAMNVPLVEFFVPDENPPPYVLTKKNEGTMVTRGQSQFGYSYEALTLGKADKYAEAFLLVLNPDDPEPDKDFRHNGQEFIYVLSGRMEFSICDDKLKLKAGDSLYFDSGLLHKGKVLGKRPVKCLCVFIEK